MVNTCSGDAMDQKEFLDLVSAKAEELGENGYDRMAAALRDLEPHKKAGRPKSLPEDYPVQVFREYARLKINFGMKNSDIARRLGIRRQAIYEVMSKQDRETFEANANEMRAFAKEMVRILVDGVGLDAVDHAKIKKELRAIKSLSKTFITNPVPEVFFIYSEYLNLIGEPELSKEAHKTASKIYSLSALSADQ